MYVIISNSASTKQERQYLGTNASATFADEKRSDYRYSRMVGIKSQTVHFVLRGFLVEVIVLVQDMRIVDTMYSRLPVFRFIYNL